MGAAWRGVRDGDPRFEQVLGTIREVSKLGMEVCVTLGQLGPDRSAQAEGSGRDRVQSQHRHVAGVLREDRHDAHLQDRLNTIAAVQESGMEVCCGGIIGMGETETTG